MQHSITLKLTATTAIAHQDASPQANNGSNMKPFNRSLSKIKATVGGVDQSKVEHQFARIGQHFPVYESVAEMLSSTDLGGEVLASFFVAQFVLGPCRGDGEGLLTGVSRYQMLSKKLRDAATCNLRTSSLWQSMTEMLCIGDYYPESQRIFATMPAPIQSAIATACLKNPQFVVALAREVGDCGKDATAKEPVNQLETLGIYQPTEAQLKSLTQEKRESLILDIPDLSGNSLGHQLRSAIALDLIDRIGLSFAEIPTGTDYLLFHGGQRSKGVKTPGDADLLEARLRSLYPGLDAMGGCPDGFLMTEGRCKLQAHILCQENNWITEELCGLTEPRSVFDMLDIVTFTRPESKDKSEQSGQMIFSHEVLCGGTEAVLKLTFLPGTRPETIGAVLCGIDYWRQREGIFGGKSARNFGRFNITELSSTIEDVFKGAYIAHVEANKDAIAKGIKDGSMGTGKIVCYAGLGNDSMLELA